jgi:mono/diheme cytochrome c family protein
VRAHVLPVALFAAFWVLLAFVVLFVAMSRGLGGARGRIRAPSRGGRRALGVIFAIVYVGFGVAIPLAFLTGNHANASSQIGGIKLTAAEKRGRELFGEHCGVCHTLAAANAVGKVGPNLDVLRPTEGLVLNTINNGCLQNPPSPSSPESCLGQGNMPAGIIQGRDAQDVAAFVAKVAGKD